MLASKAVGTHHDLPQRRVLAAHGMVHQVVAEALQKGRGHGLVQHNTHAGHIDRHLCKVPPCLPVWVLAEGGAVVQAGHGGCSHSRHFLAGQAGELADADWLLNVQACQHRQHRVQVPLVQNVVQLQDVHALALPLLMQLQPLRNDANSFEWHAASASAKQGDHSNCSIQMPLVQNAAQLQDVPILCLPACSFVHMIQCSSDMTAPNRLSCFVHFRPLHNAWHTSALFA